MKTKTIVVLGILAIAGLFTWGYFSKGGTAASIQGISTSNTSQGLLTASEKFYDFGVISMKNGNVSKDFVITNSSDGEVLLEKAITSCMCTAAYIVDPLGGTKGPFGMVGHGGSVPPVNEIIKAGESRIVRVVFDPNAHGPAGVGKIDRFVTLTDSSGKTLQLEIKATVTP